MLFHKILSNYIIHIVHNLYIDLSRCCLYIQEW